MIPIQLSTGKTIYVSTYAYYFILKDEDMALFYESCIADDLGDFVEHPFTNSQFGKVEVDTIIDAENPEDL